MQLNGNSRLSGKNVCALLFCLGIIILGAVCCGMGGRSFSPPSVLIPRLSSGQCKGKDVAPVAGTPTLAVVTQVGSNITICILRASDGVLLRHYDLAIYGTVVGSDDGLLYVNENVGQGELCAVRLSDGIERWCQAQSGAISSISAGNGNVYINSDATYQTSLTALSERDGRILWTSPMTVAVNPTNHLLLAVGSGAVYSYQTIPAGSSATSSNQAIGSGPNGVCASRSSDGRQLWCSFFPSSNVTGMVVDANTLYVRGVGDPSSSIYALDVATGAVRWSAPIDQGYTTGESSLLTVAAGVVFTNTSMHASSLDRLYAIRASDGKRLWSVLQSILVASVAATDKRVYALASSGDLHVLNMLDGNAVWSHQSPPNGIASEYYPKFVNNIIVEHDIAYMLINGDTNAYLIAVSANDGTALWRDQRCFDPYTTPTATASPAQSNQTSARCYWAGDQQQRSMQLSLLAVDN